MDLLTRLRLAEQEAIGVDRMFSLLGTQIDDAWVAYLRRIDPALRRQDVSSLLILDHVRTTGWIDPPVAARVIQRPPEAAAGALQSLASATIDGAPILLATTDEPAGTQPYALNLATNVPGSAPSPAQRRVRPASYAYSRGRVGSAEAEVINGVTRCTATKDLEALAGDVLDKRGSGPTTHYVPHNRLT